MIAGGLLGGIVGVASAGGTFETGMRVGNLLAILVCLGLSFVVLSKKNLLNNFGLILLALLSGVLAISGGGLLGLIPSAYLSTK